jgi:uncharacterized protein
MSRQPLPEYLDPVRLADQGRVFDGSIANAAMKRLNESSESAQGEALVHLEFGRDSGHRRMLRGWARTEVELTCQRCLEQYKQPLSAEFQLAIVTDEEQAERLPEDYDPLLYSGRPMRTAAIVEDELILSLPIVAMHARDDAACKGAREDTAEPNASTAEEGAKPNPFAALEQLKNRK